MRLRSFHPDVSVDEIVVTENGRLAGVLTRDALVAALATGNEAALIGQAMARDFQTADAHELLDVAFLRLQGCKCHVLPVLRNGQVVGLLTPENVGEFIMFRGVIPPPLPASGS